MSKFLSAVAVLAVILAAPAVHCRAYPVPEAHAPGRWTLDIRFRPMRMITVADPITKKKLLYWYLLYTVTNNTEHQSVRFNPDFSLLTDKLQVYRDAIDLNAFAAIKRRHRDMLLESAIEIAGPIQNGVGYAKDGVAIFREVDRETDAFKIFIGGLSDDSHVVKNPITGDDTNLYKTLERSYLLPGDRWYIDRDTIRYVGQRYIYR